MPPEVLYKIIDNLTPQDILNLGSTNKKFFGIVNSYLFHVSGVVRTKLRKAAKKLNLPYIS